jgi:hypothetical protein
LVGHRQRQRAAGPGNRLFRRPDWTPDQKRVDWTEAIDIFNAYGLKLKPVK